MASFCQLGLVNGVAGRTTEEKRLNRDTLMTSTGFRKFVLICCGAAKNACAREHPPYNSIHAALQHRPAIRQSHGADSEFLP
jgi:hypothetical protein